MVGTVTSCRPRAARRATTRSPRRPLSMGDGGYWDAKRARCRKRRMAWRERACAVAARARQRSRAPVMNCARRSPTWIDRTSRLRARTPAHRAAESGEDLAPHVDAPPRTAPRPRALPPGKGVACDAAPAARSGVRMAEAMLASRFGGALALTSYRARGQAPPSNLLHPQPERPAFGAGDGGGGGPHRRYESARRMPRARTGLAASDRAHAGARAHGRALAATKVMSDPARRGAVGIYHALEPRRSTEAYAGCAQVAMRLDFPRIDRGWPRGRVARAVRRVDRVPVRPAGSSALGLSEGCRDITGVGHVVTWTAVIGGAGKAVGIRRLGAHAERRCRRSSNGKRGSTTAFRVVAPPQGCA